LQQFLVDVSGINFRVATGYLRRLSLNKKAHLAQPAEIVKVNQEHKLALGVFTHVFHVGNLLNFDQSFLVVEQKAQDSLTHLLVSKPSSEVLITGHQLVGEVHVLAALNLVHLVLS
jgi:hypothetical protein